MYDIVNYIIQAIHFKIKNVMFYVFLTTNKLRILAKYNIGTLIIFFKPLLNFLFFF
jgi:hypothetical protein